MFSKVKSKVASWIAIAAVLVASFAPTISNALAAQSKTPWQEICSLQGIKYIPVVSGGLIKASQNQAPTQDGRMLHMEHCPYCFMHAGSVSLIHSAAPLFIAVDKCQTPPLIYSFSPQTALSWGASRSRAPPRFS